MNARYVINLCEDRARFAAAFCAAAAHGQTNLLPASAAAAAVDELRKRYPDSEVRTDAQVPAESAPVEVPGAHLAAIAFTSGSTGAPTPHAKRWDTLVAAARLSRGVLAPDLPSATVLATVPPQHMYGLEFSVFWPLACGDTLHPGRPFFAADLRAAMARLNGPVVLITTPVHLRACIESRLHFPQPQLVISATAPLTRDTAHAAEELFRAPVLEIYGCTEGGSLASRRTAQTEIWSLHPGLELDGGYVRAPHYPEPIVLQDALEPLDPRRFRLLGRAADMLKVAGKRISAAELTQRLLAIAGVRDAVVFLPEGAQRPAALVVAPALAEKDLLARLAQSIDPVFLPRPLKCVERLPRDALGKLPRARLVELLRG